MNNACFTPVGERMKAVVTEAGWFGIPVMRLTMDCMVDTERMKVRSAAKREMMDGK